MIITNLEELQAKKTLERSDEVVFNISDTQIKYRVRGRFLDELNEMYNDRIFTFLKLDKMTLAIDCYGYDIRSGGWPNSRTDDFEALTRLVKKLYEIIEERPKVYIPIESRFEILDL